MVATTNSVKSMALRALAASMASGLSHCVSLVRGSRSDHATSSRSQHFENLNHLIYLKQINETFDSKLPNIGSVKQLQNVDATV